MTEDSGLLCLLLMDNSCYSWRESYRLLHWLYNGNTLILPQNQHVFGYNTVLRATPWKFIWEGGGGRLKLNKVGMTVVLN